MCGGQVHHEAMGDFSRSEPACLYFPWGIIAFDCHAVFHPNIGDMVAEKDKALVMWVGRTRQAIPEAET